jgi:hypothetical protein
VPSSPARTRAGRQWRRRNFERRSSPPSAPVNTCSRCWMSWCAVDVVTRNAGRCTVRTLAAVRIISGSARGDAACIFQRTGAFLWSPTRMVSDASLMPESRETARTVRCARAPRPPAMYWRPTRSCRLRRGRTARGSRMHRLSVVPGCGPGCPRDRGRRCRGRRTARSAPVRPRPLRPAPCRRWRRGRGWPA